MTDLKQFKNKNAITVWRFEDAPEAWRKLSKNGGDEDWVVFVPTNVQTPHWLFIIDTMNDPQEFDVDGGTVYIGSHS